MAPLAHSQSSMKMQADILARKVSHYIELQTKYCAFLRNDPPRMQSMFKEQSQSQSPEVVHFVDPHYFEDVDGLLAKYDKALERVPRSYEEYFKFAHYAFSAAVLFNEHKVCPFFISQKGFKAIYDQRLSQLQADFAREFDPKGIPRHTATDAPTSPTFSPVRVTQNITEPKAHALLDDYPTLMKHSFICSAGSEDAFRWNVGSILITADMRTEYGVNFEGSILPMDNDKMMSLMMDSQIEAA